MARFINPVPEYRPNSQLFFFKSGTNTQLVTYADEIQSIPNAQPVLTDALGNCPNIFYSGSAKLIVLDENNVQYIERDPVGGEKELGDFTLWDTTVIYDKNDIVEGSDGKFYISLADGNQANDPTTDPTKWSEIRFIGVWNANITYETGVVVQTTDGGLWRSLSSNTNNNPSSDDGSNWLPAIDGSKVPEVIELEARNLWNGESAAFNVLSNRRYQIDASAGAVDAALSASYVAGDEIIVHNESISTNTVRLTNTALTLKGPGDTITPSDNLEIEPGNTAHIAMKTSTEGEFV